MGVYFVSWMIAVKRIYDVGSTDEARLGACALRWIDQLDAPAPLTTNNSAVRRRDRTGATLAHVLPGA